MYNGAGQSLHRYHSRELRTDAHVWVAWQGTYGLHGKVHMRPAPGQPFGQDLMIECSKTLTSNHPIGTRFRMRVKLANRKQGADFLYSYHGWKVDVLGQPD